MADIINITDLGGELNRALTNSVSSIITFFNIVGIALIIYIIYLILRAFFNWKSAAKISKMTKDVEEINAKIDRLTKKVDRISHQLIERGIKKKEAKKKGFFRRLFGKSKRKKIGENNKLK